MTPAECPDCHGAGELVFNPSPIRDPQCEDTARCPRCHGTGTAAASHITTTETR